MKSTRLFYCVSILKCKWILYLMILVLWKYWNEEAEIWQRHPCFIQSGFSFTTWTTVHRNILPPRFGVSPLSPGCDSMACLHKVFVQLHGTCQYNFLGVYVQHVALTRPYRIIGNMLWLIFIIGLTIWLACSRNDINVLNLHKAPRNLILCPTSCPLHFKITRFW